MDKQEKLVFEIILHGGNGRSSAMEAIAKAKIGEFSAAREKLEEASEEIRKAHHIQTTLIQNEIKGKPNEISLLMIHAQDHLMNALTLRDLASEIVDLYEITLT